MEPKREAICPATLFSLLRTACVRCRSIALRAVAGAAAAVMLGSCGGGGTDGTGTADTAGAFALDKSLARAALVQALFDLNIPSGGPFPSDRFTVPDAGNRTGRRVNLPLPNCTTNPSDCEDLAVVNTMDGFNLSPRISIPFDGPIDPSTVASNSVYIVELARQDGKSVIANTVGINQVVWDPETLTLHVESDDVLRQTARYAAVVTNGILDTDGRRVKASQAFKQIVNDEEDPHLAAELQPYRAALIATMDALEAVGVGRETVVAVSVFTTETATATLENIRDHLKGSPAPAPADFAIGPSGSRAVFPVSSIQSITFRQHTGTNAFVNAAVPLAALNGFSPGAVSTVAWGTFVAPQYIDSNAVMTNHGTLERPAQFSDATLQFVVFVPSGTPPASGWPVALIGHGANNHMHNTPWSFGGSLALHGFATIAINATGRGFGPLGTLSIRRTDGTTVQIPAGGRAIDQNGDGVFPAQEGGDATAPYLIIGQRDSVRQTAIEYLQLVRVIQAGIDIDGNGSPDLDGSRMVFLGYNFGTGWGTCFLAVEPGVALGVVGAPGAPRGRPDLFSLRPGGRSTVGAQLQARTPSLLNPEHGLTSFGGIPVALPFYNENIPLRDQPPLTNDIPGAMAIQEFFDRVEWVQASSDAGTHARHLEFEPLTGVPAKSMLVIFGKGDLTGPNPRTSALVRAGALREKTIFYRNDLAFAEDPTVLKDPHTFLLQFASPGIRGQVARGGQMTIGQFFASGGITINHPEPARFFELPIAVLPEDFSYIP